MLERNLFIDWFRVAGHDVRIAHRIFGDIPDGFGRQLIDDNEMLHGWENFAEGTITTGHVAEFATEFVPVHSEQDLGLDLGEAIRHSPGPKSVFTTDHTAPTDAAASKATAV